MITFRHNLYTLLVGVLLTALLLSCVLLASVLLTSCRTPRDTTTTTSVQLSDLLTASSVTNLRWSLNDTINFVSWPCDYIAQKPPQDTPSPSCLVDPLPARRIIRHAVMTANDTTTTAAHHDHNTRDVTETKSQPATDARSPFTFAFAIIAVVCFLGLVSCSFGVIAYMILKRT